MTIASEWGRPGASEILLEHGAHLHRQREEDAVGRWAGAALRGALATQFWVAAERHAVKSFGFGTGGCTVAQVADAGAGWAVRLRTLEHLVRRVGECTDVVWCGYAPRLSTWRSSPRAAERDLAQSPELRQRFVPDAHGVFVLTPEHLAKARDLSDWQLEDLGNDRTLVAHRNPAAWFADVVPDPDVLEKARADLGPMILTEDDVRAHRVSRGLPG